MFKSYKEVGYCSQDVLDLLISLVKARASIIVTGDTGSGKTELIKFLMQFIPDNTKTWTVEDNFELCAKELRPEFDCTEIKVDDRFTPRLAIKASLCQNTKWLILSKARSKETLNLLEAISTGCSVMTSVHSLDVRNIPDCFEAMIADNTKNIKDDVYTYFDVGVLIVKKETPKGIVSHLQQLCLFEHTTDGNKVHMIVEDGILNKNFKIPQKLLDKYHSYNVEVPEFNKDVANAEGDMNV